MVQWGQNDYLIPYSWQMMRCWFIESEPVRMATAVRNSRHSVKRRRTQNLPRKQSKIKRLTMIKSEDAVVG